MKIELIKKTSIMGEVYYHLMIDNGSVKAWCESDYSEAIEGYKLCLRKSEARKYPIEEIIMTNELSKAS